MEILSSQMLSYNPVQKRYLGYHKMRVVKKVLKRQQSVTVISGTEKDSDIDNKERKICK